MKKLGILLCAVLLTGCQSFQKEEGESLAKPVQKTEVHEGVEYTLKLEKGTFGEEEEIHVTGKVKNTSSFPVMHLGFGGCDPGISLTAQTTDARVVLSEKQEGELMMCTQEIRDLILDPNEEIVISKTFEPVSDFYQRVGETKTNPDYEVQLKFHLPVPKCMNTCGEEQNSITLPFEIKNEK